MILQTDSRLKPEINKYGCYFMSILYICNRELGCQLDTDIINFIFEKCVEKGYIQNDDKYKCYILNPDGIFNYMGLKAKYTQKHESYQRQCLDNEIEIICLKYDGYKHFVVGDGRGYITYNPMGKTEKGYIFDSKRIFRV